MQNLAKRPYLVINILWFIDRCGIILIIMRVVTNSPEVNSTGPLQDFISIQLQPEVTGVALEGRADALKFIGGLSAVALAEVERITVTGSEYVKGQSIMQGTKDDAAEAISIQARLLELLTSSQGQADVPFTLQARDRFDGELMARAVQQASDPDALAKTAQRPATRFFYRGLNPFLRFNLDYEVEEILPKTLIRYKNENEYFPEIRERKLGSLFPSKFKTPKRVEDSRHTSINKFLEEK